MSEQTLNTYRIVDWEKNYENATTRKLQQLRFVYFPNKHDGKGYKRVMRMENGQQIMLAWFLMVQVASKCPVRGTLADGDGPITPEDLWIKTEADESIFELAFSALSDPKIGWLERLSGDAADQSAEPANQSVEQADASACKGRECKVLEGNVMEGKEEDAPQPPEGECDHSEGNSDSSNEKPEAQNETSDSRKKIPDGLIELIEAWNELPDSICSSVRKIDSEANLKGWAKVQRDPELREILSDIPALILKIRGSPFLHGQSFFKFTWLFGKKSHEWNLTKIKDGNYEQSGNTNRGNGPSRDLEDRRQAAQTSGTEGVL